VVVIGAALDARAVFAIFTHRGFQVTVSTGGLQASFYSRERVREGDHRAQRVRRSAKTLGKSALGGCYGLRRVDTPGNALATTRRGEAGMACGRAGGADLPISPAPFILCGASLFGIESGTAWGGLASGGLIVARPARSGWPRSSKRLEIVKGRVRSRIVVRIG
jgi:hypothetical protein